MAHIILPGDDRGEKLISGVRFIDGKAESVLGRHTRRYFEALGATITDELPARDFPGVDSKKAELIDYAEKHNIEIPNGTKAEILDAIQSAPLPDAEE